MAPNTLFLKIHISLVFATPPAPRRRYIASPKPNRPNWMQRHLRRPNTVNVDDATLSGEIFLTFLKQRWETLFDSRARLETYLVNFMNIWVYLIWLLRENGLFAVHFLKRSKLRGNVKCIITLNKCLSATLRCLVGRTLTRPDLKPSCHLRFTSAFAALDCTFKVLKIVQKSNAMALNNAKDFTCVNRQSNCTLMVSF